MNCVHCNKEISPRATVCPRCGEPEPSTNKYYSPPITAEERKRQARQAIEGNRSFNFVITVMAIILISVFIFTMNCDFMAKEPIGIKIIGSFFIALIGGGFWGGIATGIITVLFSILGVFRIGIKQ